MNADQEAVQALLHDLRLGSPQWLALVEALRERVLSTCPTASETVKYGGILFSQAQPFCGIYTYREHVTLEFSQGYRLHDPQRWLEGGGKLRRHRKVRTLDEAQDPRLADFLAQAWQLASMSEAAQ